LITRARANLNDPAATHFLFVDADTGFTPEQVFRLIESGADMVAWSIRSSGSTGTRPGA